MLRCTVCRCQRDVLLSLGRLSVVDSELLDGVCRVPGYACPAGSVWAQQVTCPAGTFSQSGAAACSPCPAGRFGSTALQTSPTCEGSCSGGEWRVPPTALETSSSCRGGLSGMEWLRWPARIDVVGPGTLPRRAVRSRWKQLERVPTLPRRHVLQPGRGDVVQQLHPGLLRQHHRPGGGAVHSAVSAGLRLPRWLCRTDSVWRGAVRDWRLVGVRPVPRWSLRCEPGNERSDVY